MSKNDVNLKVDWATHAAAKYACEHWHYSKSMPMPPWNALGVWEDSVFIGVVLFGRGASPNLGRRYNLPQTEVAELLRVALKAHKTEVSRIVAIAIKKLKARNGNIRLVVSFADANQGHHGGIYQAGNWLYSGMTPKKIHFMDKDGRVWHDRQATKTGWTSQFGVRSKCAKRSECTPVYLKGKHRYLMPLDKEMRKQIEPLRKPYPKKQDTCAGSVNGSTPDNLSGSGGSIPTSALSKED